MNTSANIKARFATINELRENLINHHLQPVPPVTTLRSWFKAAGIPKIKATPGAKRGGGTAYYSVSAIEKLLRAR